MRRYVSALLGLSLCASLGGCVTVPWAVVRVSRLAIISISHAILEVIYGIPLADVWPRALAAVEGLQLHIDIQHIDGLGGDIEARRADGTRVWVWLKPNGEHSTSVSVRIGYMGDRDDSERVHRAIRQQLGV